MSIAATDQTLDIAIPAIDEENHGVVFARLESEVRSYCRSAPAVFEHASGAELADTSGNIYIDFLAGAGSLNYGHNPPVLQQALMAYIAENGITHSLDFHTAAKERFLTAFRDYVLTRLDRDYVVQFTGPTGANAVEASIKLARKVTGRETIVAFTNGFHGVTLGALALTGNSHHRQAAGVTMGGVVRAPYDGYLGDGVDTLDYLEKALDDPSSGFGYPAAVIVETVQGEGGLNTASFAWLQRLEQICRARDILLIVDDIQAGCGRTGHFFSFEPSGIQPDLVTLSKSLSGYGLPFSVVLIDRHLDQWTPGEHNGTFRGNNHAFITAAAALEHYWTSRQFAHEVQRKGKLLRSHLEAIAAEAAQPLTLKGRGLMVGLACQDGDTASAICQHAFERGLLIETSGSLDEVVKCLPPLVVEDAQIEHAVTILAESIQEVCVA